MEQRRQTGSFNEDTSVLRVSALWSWSLDSEATAYEEDKDLCNRSTGSPIERGKECNLKCQKKKEARVFRTHKEMSQISTAYSSYRKNIHDWIRYKCTQLHSKSSYDSFERMIRGTTRRINLLRWLVIVIINNK